KHTLRRSFAPAKPPMQHVASEREAQARLPRDSAKKKAREAQTRLPRDGAKKAREAQTKNIPQPNQTNGLNAA
ncbi:MAG: hypothetical protein J6W67_08660, partial [Lentisphaeria bacterium]|nr:hypothetical protein [Lentisphaeria bacterium]